MTEKITHIKVFTEGESQVIHGFRFRVGCALWTDEYGTKCATSGEEADGKILIYKHIDGRWAGQWIKDDYGITTAIRNNRRPVVSDRKMS